MTNSCGVYKITNTVTGDYYIGSSVDLRKRWSSHRVGLVNNRHINGHLQNAWNKYGAACFEFTECERCEKEQLITREQYYIDNEKPVYNVALIAGSCLGIKRSEESKRKMSETQRKVQRKGELSPNFGKHLSEETKRKLSECVVSDETRRKLSEAKTGKPGNNLGHKRSDESKRKMSETVMGHKVSDETKRKLSERVVSEETKRKLSEANKGRIVSDETKRKMSEAKLGKKNSDESKRKLSEYMLHCPEDHRRKISEALKGNFGRKPTEETRNKLSEAAKRQWAAKKATANLIHDTGLPTPTVYNLDIQKKGSTMTFDDFDHIDSMLDNIERAWEEQSAKETIK